jgi:hypothetical protein
MVIRRLLSRKQRDAFDKSRQLLADVGEIYGECTCTPQGFTIKPSCKRVGCHCSECGEWIMCPDKPEG